MADKNCKDCKYAKIIHAGPIEWSFIRCTHEPYHGKWVAEIKDCPKKKDGE